MTNIADLRDRLLRPGGRIYPAHLDLRVVPVQVADEVRAPFAWQQELHGVRFGALRDLGERQSYAYR